MDPVALLHHAKREGLRVRADGDKLVVRGPRRLEPLARQLLDHKPEVMALLVRIEAVPHPEPAQGNGHVFRGGTVYQLVKAGTGESLNLGLCISPEWAASLAHEHGLEVIE